MHCLSDAEQDAAVARAARGYRERSGERERLGWAAASLGENCPSGIAVLHIRVRPFVPKNEVDQKRVDWFVFKGP